MQACFWVSVTRNVTYASDSSGKIVAFEQGWGSLVLCTVQRKDHKDLQLRKEEDNDSRYVRDEHDIKIIRVADNGDVDFVLYGYMNRGVHEGYSGVCVYHYNSDRNVVEEKSIHTKYRILRVPEGRSRNTHLCKQKQSAVSAVCTEAVSGRY